ncbi:MAG TPA: enoyl-CoA hydratase/isomerase family protein [Acidimicrobiia bacterium]|nr:enoyl-CoA hydratase/isomerase family protein [Acidimicrobiia bacterium]
MNDDDLALVEDHGPVRTITFNRPHVLNAFDTALYRAVSRAIDTARDDDTIHAVVLHGAGRAFSSGQDLDEMARLAAGESAESGFPWLLDSVQAFDKPLLAAVHGVGVGIGCTLLAHCDLVVIGSGARLKTPFAQLGVAPEAASSYLFPQRMGWQRAAFVLLAGEWMSATQAMEWGLAFEVADDARVLDRALELAASIADAPLDSLRAIKSTMTAVDRDAITAARAREDAAFARLLGGMAARAALDDHSRGGEGSR